jgi:hypothetical protein
VAVVRYLLANNAAVLAVVPAVRIVAGDVTINSPMPALSIMEISSVPFLTVAMDGPKLLHTERVQVTALLKGTEATPVGQGYPGVKALLNLVLSACKNVHGTVGAIPDVDSVLPDIEGPDLSDAAIGLYTGSRDFIVKFNA